MSGIGSVNTLVFGRFCVQPGTRQLLVDGVPAKLGARAFDVLLALVERRDRTVGKDELLDLVWPGLVVEENNLQVQISTLRKIMGLQAIATIAGRGYQFTLAPDAAAAPARAVAPAADNKSIAVLPFDDMSEAQDQEYFADGLAEELRNVLGKIRGLRVASRVSSFSFKGKDVELTTVADKLRVATIVTGSVRKSGQRVRITAQLIQVAEDSQLWSQTYDRELDDIFAVQDDIAQSVVQELRTTLMGTQASEDSTAEASEDVKAATVGRTESAEAYRLYLQGRYFVDRFNEPDTARGVGLLKQAIELDPGFAMAWAALSRAHLYQADAGWAPLAESCARAGKAARQALAITPDLAEAHASLSGLLADDARDWKAAEAHAQRALALAPGSCDAVLAAALVARALGRTHDAVDLSRRAVALDPLNSRAHRWLGFSCLTAGQWDHADAAFLAAFDLNPKSAALAYHLTLTRLLQGRTAEAREWAEREHHPPMRLLALCLLEHTLGNAEASDAALRELIEDHGSSDAYQVAQAYAWRGETDRAFEWLERAFAQRDPGLSTSRADPELRSLHAEPRWQSFLTRMGLGA